MAITFTMRGASEESGLSVRTLYKAIGAGELPSVVRAGRRLIPARALEAYLLGERNHDTTAERKTIAGRGAGAIRRVGTNRTPKTPGVEPASVATARELRGE
jgi:hypothetical protein